MAIERDNLSNVGYYHEMKRRDTLRALRGLPRPVVKILGSPSTSTPLEVAPGNGSPSSDNLGNTTTPVTALERPGQ